MATASDLPDTRRWPCGHPRTTANTQSVGVVNGVRCRECRRKITREWARRKKAAA